MDDKRTVRVILFSVLATLALVIKLAYTQFTREEIIATVSVIFGMVFMFLLMHNWGDGDDED